MTYKTVGSYATFNCSREDDYFMSHNGKIVRILNLQNDKKDPEYCVECISCRWLGWAKSSELETRKESRQEIEAALAELGITRDTKGPAVTTHQRPKFAYSFSPYKPGGK